MKQKLIIWIGLLGFFNTGYAQEFGTGHELIKISNATFEYFENTFIKEEVPKTIKTTEQIIQYYLFGNDTSVLRSIYTDVRGSFLIYHQYEINERENTLDRKWNTVKLDFKFSFTSGNEKLTYIRYSLYSGDKLISPRLLLLNMAGDRWKIIGKKKRASTPYPSYIHGIFRKVRSEKLYHLMTGELSGDSLLDQTIRETRYQNGFDASLFLLLYNKWRKNKNQKMIDYFFYPYIY